MIKSEDVAEPPVAFVTMLVWSGIYTSRMKKLRPRIVEERLCMNCGYSLLHTETDDDGLGRCSECGTVFARGQYDDVVVRLQFGQHVEERDRDFRVQKERSVVVGGRQGGRAFERA